jgi:hypothetical protein
MQQTRLDYLGRAHGAVPVLHRVVYGRGNRGDCRTICTTRTTEEDTRGPPTNRQGAPLNRIAPHDHQRTVADIIGCAIHDEQLPIDSDTVAELLGAAAEVLSDLGYTIEPGAPIV